MNSDIKSGLTAMLVKINQIEGFDPMTLAVEYTDLNTGEKRLRLPVMAQMAWFRLKYPDGRLSVSVSADHEGFFVATARIYKDHTDPVDCYLSEASASRGYLIDKPTVSPREWAQTAAIGIALRNAGFGLQFHAAGEGFDDPAVNELASAPDHLSMPNGEQLPAAKDAQPSADIPATADAAEPEPAPHSADPLSDALKTPCPIAKYKGKTLGDLISADPKALVWIARKFTGNPVISEAATRICEQSQADIA